MGLIKPALLRDSAMMETLLSQSLPDPDSLPQRCGSSTTADLTAFKEPAVWILESSGKPLSVPVLTLLEQHPSLVSFCLGFEIY